MDLKRRFNESKQKAKFRHIFQNQGWLELNTKIWTMRSKDTFIRNQKTLRQHQTFARIKKLSSFQAVKITQGERPIRTGWRDAHHHLVLHYASSSHFTSSGEHRFVEMFASPIYTRLQGIFSVYVSIKASKKTNVHNGRKFRLMNRHLTTVNRHQRWPRFGFILIRSSHLVYLRGALLLKLQGWVSVVFGLRNRS